MTSTGRGDRQQAFIKFVVDCLRNGSLSTDDLYAKAKAKLSDLCDDNEWTKESANRPSEPVWKHDLRWAQQQAKDQGLIRRIGRKWETAG